MEDIKRKIRRHFIMTREKFAVLYDYLLFNDDGVSGIRDDAPIDMKKLYEESVVEDEECRKLGIKAS